MSLNTKENHMGLNKDYEDIPGTFVFDADRGREGYHLNQFCISLRKAPTAKPLVQMRPNIWTNTG